MKRSLMVALVALFAFSFVNAQDKPVKKDKLTSAQVQTKKGKCCPGGKCAKMKVKDQAKHEDCKEDCCAKQEEKPAEKK